MKIRIKNFLKKANICRATLYSWVKQGEITIKEDKELNIKYLTDDDLSIVPDIKSKLHKRKGNFRKK